MGDHIFKFVTKHNVRLSIENNKDYPRTYSITVEKNGNLMSDLVTLDVMNDDHTNEEIIKIALSHLIYKLNKELSRKEQ